FYSSRRRQTKFSRDWSSDVCSSDLALSRLAGRRHARVPGPRQRRQLRLHRTQSALLAVAPPRPAGRGRFSTPADGLVRGTAPSEIGRVSGMVSCSTTELSVV